MKYAVLSDIHANSDAFAAVLQRCAGLGVDKYLFLGDLVGYNADPVRCVAMAREVGFLASVRGNHDEFTISGNTELAGFNANATLAIQWTRQQLSEDDLDYLDAMPLKAVVPGTAISLVHATLDSPDTWGYVFDSHHAVGNFTYQRTQICFCGHSHVPVAFCKRPFASGPLRGVEEVHDWVMVNNSIPRDFNKMDSFTVQIEPGCKYLFNIGSIGQPRNGDPRASFAVYDSDTKKVSRFRVPYDIEAVQKKILAEGLPERLAWRLAQGC